MNFDNTYIAIRERSFAEVLDLALRLVKAHGVGLLVALIAGAAPWALLNGLLLYALAENSIWGDPGQYLFWLALLMALEAPLATAPITLYLGQVTFLGSVSGRQIARDYVACLPQMLLLQGVCRVLTAVPVVTFVMPYWLWPYLSELILLERNPLWVGKKGKAAGRLSTTRRSKNLHRGARGELFARWIAALGAGALLLLATIGGLYQLVSLLGGYTLTNAVLLLGVVPAGAWLVVGYFAIVRFLSYLDLRIR
ncbi:MAG: hypothetical protein AAGG46_07520, partial [Planctomycetota bacterium]